MCYSLDDSDRNNSMGFYKALLAKRKTKKTSEERREPDDGNENPSLAPELFPETLGSLIF